MCIIKYKYMFKKNIFFLKQREQNEREQDWEKQQIQKREALYAAQKELEEVKIYILILFLVSINIVLNGMLETTVSK